MNRVITVRSISGAVTAALFIVSKIFMIEGIILWAMIAEFRLSRPWAAVLIVLASLPSIWASVRVSMMAYDAETDPENQ